MLFFKRILNSFLHKNIKTLFILVILLALCHLFLIKYINDSEEWRSQFQEDLRSTSDLLRYKCNEITSIENNWYFCEDKNLKVKINECSMLTFGENMSFDILARTQWNCRVESFDVIYNFTEILKDKGIYLELKILNKLICFI